MAPATFAGAPLRTRSGARWDRDSIIEAIQEWVATHGEPPRAADWNPSSAKWSGQLWRVARYRAGRADGSAWPALNSAKRPFGGSLNEAIRAAGHAPAKPGPMRRRDVDPEQAGRAPMSPEGRAMIAAALARAREAERAVERLRRAAARPRVVRERVVDDAALTRARAAERRATEARTAAKRLAARLERAEATVAELRAERRGLRAERDAAAATARTATTLRDRLVAELESAEHARAAARRAEAEALRRTTTTTTTTNGDHAETTSRDRAETTNGARATAVAAPPEVRVVTVREPAPGARVVREALAAAAEAERRAGEAEAELRETVAAVKGEPRRLTPAELAALRTGGPGGPAVLARALKDLAGARAGGSATELRAALAAVAQAAVSWQDRL